MDRQPRSRRASQDGRNIGRSRRVQSQRKMMQSRENVKLGREGLKVRAREVRSSCDIAFQIKIEDETRVDTGKGVKIEKGVKDARIVIFKRMACALEAISIKESLYEYKLNVKFKSRGGGAPVKWDKTIGVVLCGWKMEQKENSSGEQTQPHADWLNSLPPSHRNRRSSCSAASTDVQHKHVGFDGYPDIGRHYHRSFSVFQHLDSISPPFKLAVGSLRRGRGEFAKGFAKNL
ncbi:hypothetical protein CPC08DRAFT_798152 [Agrocybe pediades]|nr:hypothetical protein CPC08DRAFT_798152 [Agrocybe pediades]